MLQALRGAGRGMRGEEIAELVGLSMTSARFHLDHLVAEGLVRVATEARSRPGRPPLLYLARPAEAVDGASAYRLLAGLLAAELSRDPAASVEAGRRWASRQLDADTGGDSSGGLASAVDRIMELLDDNGFEPRLMPGGASTIELHHCPFLELAAERADVICGLHLGFVRGALERLGAAARVRVIPVLDGSGPCLVTIRAARTAFAPATGSRTRRRNPHPPRPDHGPTVAPDAVGGAR